MTVTSLAFGGVTLTDSCRTAAYDSVAAYTAAVAADAYAVAVAHTAGQAGAVGRR